MTGARPSVSGLLLTIAGAVVAAAIGVHAQDRTPPPSAPASPVVVIGCISRAPSDPAAKGRNASASAPLLVTDARSDPPAVYRLDGDTAALALHVGHTVEIAGVLTSRPSSGRGVPAGARTLEVKSLIWISTTCPEVRSLKKP